ncbi:MAG TPA: glycosyltransferase family 4 protein [Anaerolineales bacterium]|nr:glycosyltransferase family 4 protein [Anaerolineales bacterium]
MCRKWLNTLKARFPRIFKTIFQVREAWRIFLCRFQILRLRKSERFPSLLYLTSNFPKRPATRREFAHGGAVKLTYLAEVFPHCFPEANVLYTVSSVGHPLQKEILFRARSKGIKIIINQNGVAFPAWAGQDYEKINLRAKQILHVADFIVYQSRFCKDSAERYLSPPDVPNEIIYNPVDTRFFSPDACSARPQALTLLLGGNQYEKYRLDLALRTLKALHSYMPNARLIVTGNLWFPRHEAEIWTKQALREMNLTDYVTFTGTYTQAEAPTLYSQAHLLLHTKYADPSPGLVLEAMALGMPVVHLNNGGVPELVGEAGIGVVVEHDWNQINLPSPQAMAEAVMQVYSRREEFSQKARWRAVELFSLEKFIERHKEILEKVLDT